ncbi:Yos1-like protein [Mycena vitilis]|nr:Yos1-like protein [Mycena vitilis]
MLSLFPTRLFKLAIYVSLLVLNALAILNEDRFLVPIGWSYSNVHAPGRAEEGDGVEYQRLNGGLIGLIHASQFMQTPLIFANTGIIVFEILFG